MARRKKSKSQASEDLVQVDIYYIPAPIADMYRVLREAVKEDILTYLKKIQAEGIQVSQDEEVGECIQASQPAFFYPLSPSNISKAQEARDREDFEAYLEQYIQ